MKIFLQKIVFAAFSIFLLTGAAIFAQVPTITSFTPASGAVGAAVTITGTNFNVTAASNIVYFGATKATVTAATATSLSVTVPAGATFKPITVLNSANGLMGSSLRPFLATYSGVISTGFLETPPVTFTGGSSPNSIAAADFDGDGKVDIAAPNGSGVLGIHRNTSTSGSFTSSSFAARVDFAVGSSPSGIATEDLDGDGKQDIVVVNAGSNTITVFRNQATSGSITASSFAAGVELPTLSSPYGVTIGDLDGDGKNEIVITNNGAGSVSVFRNTTSSGSITAAGFSTRLDFSVGSNPYQAAIGDIDGDGKRDLSVVNYSSNTLSVLRNLSVSGTISFNAKVDFATGSNPNSIVFNDVDGDGKGDISITNYSSATVSVFRNTATSGSIVASSLAARVDFSTTTFPSSIVACQLNGDGKPDFAVSNFSGSPISILQNNAVSGSITTSSFAPVITFPDLNSGYALAAADFDGDARTDLALTYNTSTSSIALYRNNPAPVFSSFSPASGAGGTTVTINGRNFTGATAVRFNAVNATSFTVVNDNQITAVAPTGVTTGFVSVVTAVGTGTSTTFFFAAPTITSFTPLTGGSGSVVTITGTNLLGTTGVQFGPGGTSAPSGTPTNTSLTVQVPGDAITGSLTLSTPYGSATSAATFTPTVLISSFSPGSGTGGTQINIFGSKFTGATAVRVNNVAVSSFSVISDNLIQAVLQNGLTSGVISVTSPSGTGSSINTFFGEPSITSFTPTAAASGATVTITGINFTGATSVNFNGVSVTPTTVSATSITVAVPAGARTGQITVTTPYGSVLSPSQFTAVPVINSFGPSNAQVGAQVDISGFNFTGATAVRFNTTSVSYFTVNSSTSISAIVPTGLIAGVISVTNAAGTGTSANTFTPEPTIISFSPISGPVGTTVTLTGLNFTGATEVRFNGFSATPTSVTATSITVAVPAGANGTSTIRVYVGSIYGTSSDEFSITSAPTLSFFNPTSGAIGSEVLIYGSSFIGVTAVRVNGIAVNSYTVIDNGTISAIVPNNATSGLISVTTGQGTVTSSSFFVVTPAPVITGYSQPFGSPGQTITVFGQNLSGASSIRFGGTSGPLGTITNFSATSVTAVIPIGALSGQVRITTPIGTALSVADFKVSPQIYTALYSEGGSFTYVFGNASNFYPGSFVRIDGINLSEVLSITFNGIPSTNITNIDESKVGTQIPESVSYGYGIITVTTPYGTTSFGKTFLTGFTPTSGAYGTVITLTGANFNCVSDVFFDGKSSSFSIISPTQISAVVPLNATSGKISLTGCTPSAVTSSTDFIVLRAPEVSSFTPTAGGAGTVVTITGNHFLGATAVRFNNVAATSFTVIDNNTIQATAPTGVTSGVLSVVHPGGTTSSTQVFNLMAAPTITATGLSVLTGPVGTQVTITGTNFLAPASQTSVSFAGIACPFSIISATQILAVIPPGGFTSSITVKTPGGSANSTQQFTPTGITTVRVDSVTAVPNLQIVVPVRARGFANLIGLQFNVPTPAGLTYVGVEQLNSTLGLTTANFSNINGVQFSWTQASNTATSLSDNTVLFAIRYSVPVNTLPGTKFNLVVPVNGLPLPLEATKSDFTIQNSTAINGFVRIALASISGNIKTGNGTGVPRAILVMKTSNTKIPKADTTASDGSFSYDSLVVGANYSMQADKNTDPFPTNGVTVSDIALIQRHVLATSLLGNAYKVIAADVDNSKSVTVADVAFIRDLILQTRSSFPLGKLWKMVKASQTFADANSPWPLDTSFTYTGLPLSTASQNFIGCKLGDVNDSWNSAFGRSAVTSSSSITLSAGNATVNSGQNFTIPVVTAESDAMALQFTLRWPKDKLQLVSATPAFGGCVIGTPNDSTLTVLVTDPAGSLIPAGSTLLNLQFTAMAAAGSEVEVKITGDVTPALAYDSDLIQMNLHRVPGLISISGTTGISQVNSSKLVKLWPNPSHGSFYVKAGIGSQFDLQDALGRKVFSQKLDKELTEISLNGVSAGIYQVKVGTEVLRLVVE